MYFFSKSELDTRYLGASLASVCNESIIIYLCGSVGSGKTVFCKGFLRKLGYLGHVKSPTYTFLETYNLNYWDVYHCDFYRLNNIEELKCLGIQDYLSPYSLFLIEWPLKLNEYFFLKQDILISIIQCKVNNNRQIKIKTFSNLGKKTLKCLLTHWKM